MEVLAGGRPLSSARARQVAGSREELLGLLADYSGRGGEPERELSFSDFVAVDTAKPSPRRDGGGDRAVAMTTLPAVENGQGRTLPSSSEQQEATAASKQQAAAAAARERRLRRRRSDSRGSCGGSGDGVLLNFYVPGLLTRSMTTPRPARGTLPAAAAPATAAASKARIDAPPAVGCWPALWGRDRRKPAKPASGRRDTRVPV
ncbi:hypothetical protein E2562_006306 [Oryza meyeriana var. granulata]|uniref:Uncharacterized protein n=1 Tax=Oryza meyeriana var. granulata TaxID=110450 RepID=A0A6G1EG69_9ORYZ|nr:hypothetical protein E2562_006306 [Oryza meyeriana var. granulata]